MKFNYAEFLYDNGIVGTTVGTLIGFSTSKLFEVLRTEFLEPYLYYLFSLVFVAVPHANNRIFAACIEYLVILFLTYLVTISLIMPFMSKYIIDDVQAKYNSRSRGKKLLETVTDIKKIL